jgi:hypothetical protein
VGVEGDGTGSAETDGRRRTGRGTSSVVEIVAVGMEAGAARGTARGVTDTNGVVLITGRPG